MIIQTKYNINDELWFVQNSKANKAKVIDIKVEISSVEQKTSDGKRGLIGTNEFDPRPRVAVYRMSNGSSFSEHNLFITQQELIENIKLSV